MAKKRRRIAPRWGVAAQETRGRWKAQFAYSARRLHFESLEYRLLLAADFGDAPAPYATLLAANGARHEAIGPTLGALRDVENDGVPSTDADGDDASPVESDDEDGVAFGNVRVGQLGAVVTVNVQNAPAGARLDAWIDFNRDGNWGGNREQIASSVFVHEGSNQISFDVPSDALSGDTIARFRLSTGGGLGPGGPSADGEVEDWKLQIGPSVGFGEASAPIVIPTERDRDILAVAPADFDQDGDVDVLALASDSGVDTNDYMYFFENLGGERFQEHYLGETFENAYRLSSADIDGDGDLDVLVGGDKLAWYENTLTNVFVYHEVATGYGSSDSVLTADIDGDGDIDFLMDEENSDTIAWYQNDGAQNFARRVIAANLLDVESLSLADLDTDGDMDVVAAIRGDNSVVWYENNGANQFAAKLLASGIGRASAAIAIDLDRDGDIDVVSYGFGPNTLRWHENDGNQVFTTRQIFAQPWSTSLASAEIVSADFDGDQDVDLLLRLSTGGTAWFINDGAQTFANREILEDSGALIALVDLDRDEDLDFVTTTYSSWTLAWYKNAEIGVSVAATNSRFSEKDANPVQLTFTRIGALATSSSVSFSIGGTAIFGQDYNQSGADSFTTTGGTVVFSPGEVTKTILFVPIADSSFEIDETIQITLQEAADYDVFPEIATTILLQDGNLADFGDAPAPYPTGRADNGARHKAIGPQLGSTRDAEFDGQPNAMSSGDDVNPTAAGDDEDGVAFAPVRVGQLDATVVVNVQNAPAGAYLDAWIDFDGDGAWLGSSEFIARRLVVVDGDNIIHFDVPSDAKSGAVFARFRLSTAGGLAPDGAAFDGEVEDHLLTIEPPSDAGGMFGPAQSISTGSSSFLPQSISAVDMDSDGDLDVLAYRGVFEGPAVWFEQVSPGSYVQHTITSGTYLTQVLAVDFDQDGDIDLLVQSRPEGSRLFRNDGHQQFTSESISEHELSHVSVADVDSDGDFDVVGVALDGLYYIENSAGQFTTRILADTSSTGSTYYDFSTLADLDGDGDIDIIANDTPGHDRVRWFENDGAENFTLRTVGDLVARNFGNLFVLDFDRDGDLDILFGHRSLIGWFENNGNQAFAKRAIFLEPVSSFQECFPADIDGDGDWDILSTSSGNDFVVWHENDGAQKFTQRYITTTADGVRSVYAADFDGDGDLDVITQSSGVTRLAWYENIEPVVSITASPAIVDETGATMISYSVHRTGDVSLPMTVVFTVGGTAQFGVDYVQTGAATFSTASGSVEIPAGSSTAVIQLTPVTDGLSELSESVTLSLSSSNNYTVGYKSTASVQILDPRDFGDAPDSYRTLEATGGARHLATGPRLGTLRDSEIDGHPDLMASSDDAAGSDDEDGVAFGMISVGQSQATVTVNVQNAPAGARLDAWFDFNGDGQWLGIDEQIARNLAVVEGDNVISFRIPASAAAGSTFARFRLSSSGNLPVGGLANDGEVEDHIIVVQPPAPSSGEFSPGAALASTATARSVLATDLDDDGDADIVATFGNSLAWYENQGSLGFAEHILSTALTGARSVQSVDLDRDGDRDLLVASPGTNSIVGFINNGSEVFSQLVFANSSKGATGVQSVFPVDMDGDGDFDIVSTTTSSVSGALNWYEQTTSLTFAVHPIASIREAYAATATDFDFDGDVDIVSGSLSSGAIAWYENNGSQSFTTRTLSSILSGNQLTSIQCVDLNGDGDFDILYSMASTSQFTPGTSGWLENNGNLPFTLRSFGTGSAAQQVLAADLDGDGDVDVLSTRTVENAVVWYENGGASVFSRHVIASGGSPSSLSALDFDGDGDLDAAVGDSSSIKLYANLNVAPAIGDYDHNGIVDSGDYSLWRSTFGSTFDLRADGNRNAVIDAGDYVVWRKYQSAAPSVGSASTTGGQSSPPIFAEQFVATELKIEQASTAPSSKQDATTESAHDLHPRDVQARPRGEHLSYDINRQALLVPPITLNKRPHTEINLASISVSAVDESLTVLLYDFGRRRSRPLLGDASAIRTEVDQFDEQCEALDTAFETKFAEDSIDGWAN